MAGRPIDPARRGAREAEALTYGGAPCKRGHVGTRYTSTGACVDCVGRRPAVARDEFALLFV